MKMSWVFARALPVGLILIFLIFSVSAAGEGFWVFEEQGQISVRDMKTGQVYQSAYSVELLPQPDRGKLIRGIYCADGKDLARLIENFCS